MRRAAAAVAIVLLAGGAWIAFTELWNHGGDRPVAWRVVPHGLGAVELPTPVFLHFRKRRYLETFLAKRALPGPPPAIPAVDWAHDEVVLATAGARSSTGYSVHIASVSEQRSRIVVRVREVTPSLGQPVTARVTYPYLLATIPQSPKHVHFIWLGRP